LNPEASGFEREFSQAVDPLGIIFLAVAALALLATLQKSRKPQPPGPCFANGFFPDNEHQFFAGLSQAFPRHIVLAQLASPR
jgi:hypothetical protein